MAILQSARDRGRQESVKQIDPQSLLQLPAGSRVSTDQRLQLVGRRAIRTFPEAR